MEAGLPSTKGEEMMMSKEPLLQDHEVDQPRTARQTSTTRRVLVALAVCSVLGLGLATVGGAMHGCPGHLNVKHHAEKVEAGIFDLIHGDTNTSKKHHARDARRRVARQVQTPGPDPTTAVDTATQSQSATVVVPDTQSESATRSEPTAPNSATQSNEQTQSEATQSVASSERSSQASRTVEQSSEVTTEAQSTDDSQTTSAAGERTTTSEELESTVTTGTRRTSKPVQKVFTSTKGDGGVTTLTSTSWLAVVPSADAESDKGGDPDLQNDGSQYSVAMILQAVFGMIAGGFMLL